MAGEKPKKVRKETVKRGCAGLFFFLVLIMGSLWGAGLGVFVWVLDDAKTTISALEEFRPNIGSKVYSSDGKLLGQFTIEERQLVPLNEMPLHLLKAFIATEDHPFYEHKGVRPDAIINAALQGVRTGHFRGGSTITQQVVRNVKDLSIGTERTIQRKIREAIVALQVEREFTKDEILELYLNQIFLGISAYGVEAASRQYYSKSCRDLTLGEAATLAGLTRAPNVQEPIRNPENALARRNIVLAQMLDPQNAFITQAEYEIALAEDLDESVVTPEERIELEEKGEGVWAPSKFQAPYFVEEVRRKIYAEYDKDEVLEQGMEINTTIDMRMQDAAEKALEDHLAHFDENKLNWLTKTGKEAEFVPVSGALVCIDNRPGYEGFIRAMVGGRDFDTIKFNSATQARRLIGSSIKPFVWAAAIGSRRGITPSTVIIDEPFERSDSIGRVWRPKNYSGKFEGPMSIRYALERSVNIVAIKLVEQIGVPTVRSYLQRCGIQTDVQGLTIALGTPQVSVLELCSAYSTFANGGTLHSPVMITDIKDRDGLTRYDYKQTLPPPTEAMGEDVAYVVNHLLQGITTPVRGGGYYTTAGWASKLGRPRGGKTGTTNDSRDAWFSGFTKDFTCIVWVGYADNRPLGKGRDRDNRTFTGGHQAGPPWLEFMKAAHEGLPIRNFKAPDGVDFYSINRRRGNLGGSYREAYLKGTRPPELWYGDLYDAIQAADEELELESL
jgi:penicillin-binding protein 1A